MRQNTELEKDAMCMHDPKAYVTWQYKLNAKSKNYRQKKNIEDSKDLYWPIYCLAQICKDQYFTCNKCQVVFHQDEKSKHDEKNTKNLTDHFSHFHNFEKEDPGRFEQEYHKALDTCFEQVNGEFILYKPAWQWNTCFIEPNEFESDWTSEDYDIFTPGPHGVNWGKYFRYNESISNSPKTQISPQNLNPQRLARTPSPIQVQIVSIENTDFSDYRDSEEET